MPQLKETMTPTAEVVSLHASTAEAARRMKAHNLPAMPVYSGEELVGMVTARDLVRRVMALGQGPDEARVCDVMTPCLAFCYEDDDTESASKMMSEMHLRGLPVLSKDKRVVGIVTLPSEPEGSAPAASVKEPEPVPESPWAIKW
jgi:CBS domain-containing protein